MNARKKIAGVVLAAGVGLGGALVAAPAANANVASYLQALQAGGFGNYTAGSAIATGNIACNTPGSAADKARAVYYNTAGSIDWAEAQYITASALIHLC